jgi:hypothetical protein
MAVGPCKVRGCARSGEGRERAWRGIGRRGEGDDVRGTWRDVSRRPDVPSVIQRPRRAGPARIPLVAGRRIQPGARTSRGAAAARMRGPRLPWGPHPSAPTRVHPLPRTAWGRGYTPSWVHQISRSALDCASSPRRRTSGRRCREFIRPGTAEASTSMPAAAPWLVRVRGWILRRAGSGVRDGLVRLRLRMTASRSGRCGVRAGEAPSGTRQRPESGLSAFPAAGSPALRRVSAPRGRGPERHPSAWTGAVRRAKDHGVDVPTVVAAVSPPP